MLKDVSDVDGPSTLEDFTGVLILLQMESTVVLVVISVGMPSSEEITQVL